MGLYRRRDSKKYWITYLVNGKKVSESTGETNKRRAELVYARRIESAAKGTLIPRHNSKVTFSDLADEYLKWAKFQRAFRSKAGFIKALLEVFGDKHLRFFSSREVEQFQRDLLDKGKKPSTVNRHVATLKHMFTKAVEWEFVGEESLRKVRLVKQLRENNRRLRYLTLEECESLIESCSPHLRPIVITALNTGMRKKEILSLEWDKHIDLENGFILLDAGDTKNGERREININPALKKTLQGLKRHIESPYVFIDPQGRRFTDIKRSFTSARKRAGIKEFRFHDLRHTFASHLVMSGVDIVTVKELLGHKTLAMTLRYAHLAPSHKAKALENLYGGGGYVLATVDKKEGVTHSVTP